MNIEMKTIRRGAFIYILLISMQILFPFPLLLFFNHRFIFSFFSKLHVTFEVFVYFAPNVRFNFCFSPIGLVELQVSINKPTSQSSLLGRQIKVKRAVRTVVDTTRANGQFNFVKFIIKLSINYTYAPIPTPKSLYRCHLSEREMTYGKTQNVEVNF